jgi:hypothetical protein
MVRRLRGTTAWVLGWWLLGWSAVWADDVVKTIPSDCAARLLEEHAQDMASTCYLSPNVIFIEGRYALLDIHVRCKVSGNRGPDVSYRKGCHVVLDTEKYTIVGESHGTGWFRPIGVLEVAGQPLILVEKIRQWVLIRPDGSEAVPYAWDCPEEKCIGQMSYRARLIDRGVFPEGPLRVAVIRSGEPFLLSIYDLYPAPEGRKRGTVQTVERLVPREDWNRTWLQVTKLEEEMRRIYLGRSVLQKLRDLALDLIPGFDLEAELKKTLQYHIEGAPRQMRLFYHPEQGFFLATQRPLTLTHVDPRSRSFRVLPPRGVGPLQPISLVSSLTLMEWFPEGRDTAWGFVHGAVFETEAQYNLRHPQTQPCPWRETLPNGQVSCIFFVDLMLRIPWDTLDMAEWWILREYDGRGEDQIVRVLRVDGDAVEYLETTPGKGASSASLVVKRKFFR